MRTSLSRTVTASIAVGVLLLAACGSDDDDSGAPPTSADDTSETTGAPEPSDSETTEAEPEASIDTESALFMVPPEEGADLVVEDSGTFTGRTDISVTAVEETDEGITVTTREVVSNDAGDPVTVERRYTTLPDGGVTISAAGFFATGTGFEVTATGDDIVIPSIAELSGGAGTEGNTFVEIEADGFSGRNDVTYSITSGGAESVTTPLGTFDAQIVNLALTIDSSAAGEVTGTVKYSFLPGWGVLKTEVSLASVSIVSTVASSTVAP